MRFWKLIANVIVWAARRASRAVGAGNMLAPLHVSKRLIAEMMELQWLQRFERELNSGLRVAQQRMGLA